MTSSSLRRLGRWEFPEDKYELRRWIATMTLKRVRLDICVLTGALTVSVMEVGKRRTEYIDVGHGLRRTMIREEAPITARYQIPEREWKVSRLGWRYHIALAIRECRRLIREGKLS